MPSFESLTDPAEALAATDLSPQLQGQDFQEGDEFGSHREDHVAEPPSTDDPVRVYLREMGSVRLLTRQGEIELAKRMERGKLRMRKPLSRSPSSGRRCSGCLTAFARAPFGLRISSKFPAWMRQRGTNRERRSRGNSRNLCVRTRIFWTWSIRLRRHRSNM